MRFALAPLQWLATPDGWLDRSAAPPLETLLSEVRRLGFRAIKSEPPEGLEIAEYARALREAGLTPAPGYIPVSLEDVAGREESAARVGSFAERLRALGVGEVLVGARMSPDAPRIATPAVGIDADERRLGAIARTLEAIGAATRRHGVTTCLHPHVGTWVETEAETEWLVERLDPALVALGPDSGHLAWAGVDVVAFARRHAERIAAVHVKDVRLDVVHRTRATDASYRDVVREGVWAEPGLGDLDLVGFLAALGAGFEGWAVVEVDRPSMGSPEESIEACGRWVESVVAADP